jgi:hypothetical protein
VSVDQPLEDPAPEAEDAWPHTVLGGVRKSEIIGGDRDRDPRLVDVVCSECHARLAKVTDGPGVPRLTVWAPGHMAKYLTDLQRVGEPVWTLESGPLPSRGGSFLFHCFEHGGRVAEMALIRARAAKRPLRRPREVPAGPEGPPSPR